MKQALNSAVALVERAMPDGDTVRAACVTGSQHRVVIDTLMAPADVATFGAASLVVYTHCDWDHCWGTAAFPGVPIIGQRLTREMLQAPAAAQLLAAKKHAHPHAFVGAAIILPDILFDQTLTIDAGDVTLALHHVPGHMPDAIVVHIPEYDLLLAGDVAEGPIPSFNTPGDLQKWAPALRRWAASGVKQVVPSHGAISGPELLVHNADYVETILGHVAHGLALGHSLEEMQANLPVEKLLPDVARYSSYYRNVHPQNIATARLELSTGSDSLS